MIFGVRSVVQGCEGSLWFSWVFSICPKMAASTLLCFHSRQELADRGRASQKFPGDICLFLISYKWVMWLLLVAGVSGKVYFISLLHRRGRDRRGNWNKYHWTNLWYLPCSLRKFSYFLVNIDLNFSYHSINSLRFL